MSKRVRLLLIAGVVLTACSEPSEPTGLIPVPVDANQSVLATLTCRVDAAASTLSCAPAGPAAAAGRSSDLVLGGQNVYVKLTSTNVITNPTVSITADVTVKNLTGQPWNTGDGTTIDTAGVKVFFVNLPTSPVVIANPTGSQPFTSSSPQPYFKYSGTSILGADGILTAGETSSPINWQFTLNGASTFTFGVLIVAKMPDETGTLRWVRDTLAQVQGTEYLEAVWGTSASDVWVGAPSGGPNGLQHWNGSAWTPTGGYCTLAPLKCDVTALWGSASNDVWAVGTEILHYDGTSWSLAYTPATTLRAIWGSGSTDVYAAGDQGDIYHYNGSAWTPLSHATTGLGTEIVTSIWGTSASNVYFGTSDASTTGGLGVRRFNGAIWTTVSAGINSVRALWGSGPSDIYAGGDNGLLRHYNGSSFTTVVAGFSATPGDAIFSIWGSAPDNVFVTETNGSIWHHNAVAGSWVKLPSTGLGLYGIWGSGRDVFAVGYVGPGAGANAYSPVVARGMR
ncbi:MAG TPA: hypothetical protein VGP25_12945 [Gemmatimonadaceae bacterium]|jgi:hypothetical protein|nr:hypothetical protein [Gemmatimonadaceae bacterium]